MIVRSVWNGKRRILKIISPKLRDHYRLLHDLGTKEKRSCFIEGMIMYSKSYDQSRSKVMSLMIKSREFMILHYYICCCIDNACYIISLWTRAIFINSGTWAYPWIPVQEYTKLVQTELKVSNKTNKINIYLKLATLGQTGHVAVARHDLHLAEARYLRCRRCICM